MGRHACGRSALALAGLLLSMPACDAPNVTTQGSAPHPPTSAAAPEVAPTGASVAPAAASVAPSFPSAVAPLGGTSMKIGAISVTDASKVDEIPRVIRAREGRFLTCYEDGLLSSSDLRGRVSVTFVIGLDGTIGAVSAGGDLPDSTVVGCVAQGFYGLTFAPPKKVVKVSVPLQFNTSASPAFTLGGKDFEKATIEDLHAAVVEAGITLHTQSVPPDGGGLTMMYGSLGDRELTLAFSSQEPSKSDGLSIHFRRKGVALHRGNVVLGVAVEEDKSPFDRARALLRALVKTRA